VSAPTIEVHDLRNWWRWMWLVRTGFGLVARTGSRGRSSATRERTPPYRSTSAPPPFSTRLACCSPR